MKMNMNKKVCMMLALGFSLASAELYSPQSDYYGLKLSNWSSQATQVGGEVEVGMYARTPGIGYSEEILVHFDHTAIQGGVESAKIIAHVTYSNPGWVWGSFIPQIKVFEQNRYGLASGTPTWGNLGASAWLNPLVIKQVSSGDVNTDLVLESNELTALVQAWVDGTKVNNGVVLAGDFKHETRIMKINSVNIEVEAETTNPLTTTQKLLGFEDLSLWTKGPDVTTALDNQTFTASGKSFKVLPQSHIDVVTSQVVAGGVVSNVGSLISYKMRNDASMILDLAVTINGQNYVLGAGTYEDLGNGWRRVYYSIAPPVRLAINGGSSFSIRLRHYDGPIAEFIIDDMQFEGATVN
jgi:hypothetical protein